MQSTSKIPHRFQTFQFRGCAGCESSVASLSTSIPSIDANSETESSGLMAGGPATGFSSSDTTGGVLPSSIFPERWIGRSREGRLCGQKAADASRLGIYERYESLLLCPKLQIGVAALMCVPPIRREAVPLIGQPKLILIGPIILFQGVFGLTS